MPDVVITIEEQKAIASLKRLAKKWPHTLKLFSWGGSLTVMKNDANDMSCLVDHIHGIKNDGGDPTEVEVNQFADVEYEK